MFALHLQSVPLTHRKESLVRNLQSVGGYPERRTEDCTLGAALQSRPRSISFLRFLRLQFLPIFTSPSVLDIQEKLSPPQNGTHGRTSWGRVFASNRVRDASLARESACPRARDCPRGACGRKWPRLSASRFPPRGPNLGGPVLRPPRSPRRGSSLHAVHGRRPGPRLPRPSRRPRYCGEDTCGPRPWRKSNAGEL